MKAHPHAENMRLYAEDAAETDKPWERWERRIVGERWTPLGGHPMWDWGNVPADFRRKQRPLERWLICLGDGDEDISHRFVPTGSIWAWRDVRGHITNRTVKKCIHLREVTE